MKPVEHDLAQDRALQRAARLLCRATGASGASVFRDGSFVTLRVELTLAARLSISGATPAQVLAQVRDYARKRTQARRAA